MKYRQQPLYDCIFMCNAQNPWIGEFFLRGIGARCLQTCGRALRPTAEQMDYVRSQYSTEKRNVGFRVEVCRNNSESKCAVMGWR